MLNNQNFFNKEDICSLRGYIYIGNYNIFSLIDDDEIEEAEKILGYPFPSQLKNFYHTIGYGSITTSIHQQNEPSTENGNEVLPPLAAANFAKGILFWEGQQNWMSESAYEFLEPGDLPFFEIGDSSNFLVMKLNSDNPNAVWCDDIKIEDSFEKFIWRLYYESPSFYGDIIAANCPPAKTYTPPIEPSNPLEALWEGYENGGKYAGKSYFLKTLCCRQSFDELLLTIQQLPRERVSTISLMFNALIKEALSRSDLIKEECKELLNCLMLKQEE